MARNAKGTNILLCVCNKEGVRHLAIFVRRLCKLEKFQYYFLCEFLHHNDKQKSSRSHAKDFCLKICQGHLLVRGNFLKSPADC
jgi:hypothetical protein